MPKKYNQYQSTLDLGFSYSNISYFSNQLKMSQSKKKKKQQTRKPKRKVAEKRQEVLQAAASSQSNIQDMISMSKFEIRNLHRTTTKKEITEAVDKEISMPVKAQTGRLLATSVARILIIRIDCQIETLVN